MPSHPATASVCSISPSDSAHAGNISAAQAWENLLTDPRAVLVDVRTEAEWVFVGVPDLSSLGKDALFISWKFYPGFARNENFTAQLQNTVGDKSTPLYFMCRSGGRSLDAANAMASLGYVACYNIEDGFEGNPDANGQRGKQTGWKFSALPWKQG